MGTYNLFLDDIRTPMLCLNYRTKYMPESRVIYGLEDWVIVRNHNEFIEKICDEFNIGNFPKIVSFDHDLADIHYDSSTYSEHFSYYEETGADSAKFLVNFCIDNKLDLPKCYIHSSNTVGAERIYENLQDYYRYKNQ